MQTAMRQGISVIEFKPAIRVNTAFIGAFAGASGSGKTKSALELAVGLAGPNGKIAVIDSEGRRALHYADDYKFDHGDWRPPFTPDSLLEALQGLERAGYAVTIVDSASDEYEGEGGLIDMAAAEERIVHNTAAAWAKPKAQHKLIIKWLRQTKMHVIFCLRAEEKVKLEKRFNEQKRREETVVVPIGWVPICEKRFMFDMTASFLFTPDHEGRGKPTPIKPNEKFNSFFPRDQFVTRKAGEALAKWCAGGLVEPEAKVVTFDLMAAGEENAKLGTEKLREWWTKLTPGQRGELGAHGRSSGPHMEKWKEIAQQASPLPSAEQPADDGVPDNPASPQAETFEEKFGIPPMPDPHLNDDDAFHKSIIERVAACETQNEITEVVTGMQWRFTKLPTEKWNEIMSDVGKFQTAIFERDKVV